MQKFGSVIRELQPSLTRVVTEVCTKFRENLEKEASEARLLELSLKGSDFSAGCKKLIERIVRQRGRQQAAPAERTAFAKVWGCARARPVEAKWSSGEEATRVAGQVQTEKALV